MNAAKYLLRKTKRKLQHVSRYGRKAILNPLRSSDRIRKRLNLPSNKVVSVFNLTSHSCSPAINTETGPKEEQSRKFPNFPNANSVHWRYKEYNQASIQSPYCHTIKSVLFWGNYGGNILTSDGLLIEELSPDVWGSSLHEIHTKTRLPKPQRLPGKTLSLCTKEAKGNFWHWTFDLLPKIKIIQDAGHAIDSFDHVLVNWENQSYQRESLEQLGVDLKKIVRTSKDDLFQLDQIVTATYKDHQYDTPVWATKWLRESLTSEKPQTPTSKRLFLSRDNCGFRKLVDEADLINRLNALGFEKLNPDKLNISEQIWAFENAEIIVGPHGSAFSNILFCDPETLIIELMSDHYVDLAFWTTTHHFLENHHVLIQESQPPCTKSNYPHSRKDDIEFFSEGEPFKTIQRLIAESLS